MFWKLLLVISVFIGTQASAIEWLTNRDTWNRATLMGKVYFVQGVFTEMTQRIVGDGVGSASAAEALHACATKNKITDTQLVEIVDAYYEGLEHWKNPPHVALRAGMTRFCGF